MARKETLIQKVKGLVKRARIPRFLNKYGPKRHPLWQFYLCHTVYTVYCRCWRRAAVFMGEFYGISLHWTTWQKAIAKWPRWVWHALARASVGEEECFTAAIDGTGISRSNPSQHYLHRIDHANKVSRPVQEMVMIDVENRRFLSWRIRAKQRGETCDVPYLIRQSPLIPDGVLMDKGFDSNPLHTWLREQGIWSVAPVRKGCKRGRFRKQLRDCFDWALYWQRNIVESLIGAVKRLFGTHVRARTARTQYAELSSRFIAYNIKAIHPHDFLLSLCHGLVCKFHSEHLMHILWAKHLA